MSSEKFEFFSPILELPYNIGICTNIEHTNSLHPPNIDIGLAPTKTWLNNSMMGEKFDFENFVNSAKFFC